MEQNIKKYMSNGEMRMHDTAKSVCNLQQRISDHSLVHLTNYVLFTFTLI